MAKLASRTPSHLYHLFSSSSAPPSVIHGASLFALCTDPVVRLATDPHRMPAKVLDRPREKLPFISVGFRQASFLHLPNTTGIHSQRLRPPSKLSCPPARQRQTNGIVSPSFFSPSSSFCAQDVAFALRSARIPGSVVKRSRLDRRGGRGEGEGAQTEEGGRQTVQSESRFNWTAFLCDPRRDRLRLSPPARPRPTVYILGFLPPRRRLKNKRLGPPSLLRLCSPPPPKLLVTDPSL